MKSFFRMMFASMIGTGLALMMIFFFFVVSLIGMAGLSKSDSWKKLADIDKKSILHIKMSGPILERVEKMDVIESFVSYDSTPGIGLFELTETLKAAGDDENIKGLFLHFEGLSAGWGHLSTLKREIEKFKEKGKFVIAYSEAFDERSYFVASVADEIALYPRGFFEWDGMASQKSFFKGVLEKWEVEPEIFRAGKYKSAIEPFIADKMSKESREQTRALIDAMWGALSGAVQKRTQTSPDKLENWANDVSVVYAQDALEKGFVTHLASYEEMEKKLMELTGDKEEPGLLPWGLYYKQKLAEKSPKGGDQIAVIFADGAIVDGEGDRGKVGSGPMSRILREIARDEKIKGVVLRVNSPGGSALASDVIWTSTQFLKEKKPIVASFGNVAASGGYYISAGANAIFAEPTTITGSIGVFGLRFMTQKFWNNTVGMTFDSEKSHLMSDRDSTTRPLTPLEKRKMQNVVDHIYNDFLKVVTSGRPQLKTINDVHELAQGRVWAGVDGKKIGLVDEYGGLEEAIAKAAELAELEDYEVVDFPREKNPFEEFFDQFGQVAKLQLKMLLPKSVVSLFDTFKPKDRFIDHVKMRMPYDYKIQ